MARSGSIRHTREVRSLRRLLRDLSGRSSQRFVDLITAQVDVTLEGARHVRSTVAGEVGRGDSHDRMRVIEHEGDAARGALVRELAIALTTPIDREDLFRVSRSIDDVLDNLRDFAREMDLYRIENREVFAPVVDAVVAGVEALRETVTDLDELPRVSESSLAAKKASGYVRRLYEKEVAGLFAGTLDMEMLKRRELLRRLDVVGLRLGEAADALADGAMKRRL